MFAVLLWLGACGTDGAAATVGASTDVRDSAGALDSAEPDVCVRQLDVTWQNWAGGFVRTQCQGCHATRSPNRYGAPESVFFDDEASALALAPLIYDVVVVSPSMPPSGGVTDEERFLVDQWLRCRVPASERTK